MEEPLALPQGDPALLGSTEGARRATGVEPSRAAAAAGGNCTLDPEVAEKPKRRSYSAEYKVRILEQADACSEPGQIGALLRREGLYSSHLVAWRKLREDGVLAGLLGKVIVTQGPRDLELALEHVLKTIAAHAVEPNPGRPGAFRRCQKQRR